MLRLAPFMIFLMGFTLQGYGQKEPLPQPSDHPFYQARYLAYKRDMSGAEKYYALASDLYKESEQTDSLCMALLSQARMRTLTGNVPGSQELVVQAETQMASLQDTLAWLKAYYPFVITGNALASYDIQSADSLGRIALTKIEAAVGVCHPLRINMLNDHGVVQYYKNDYLRADSLVEESLKCALTLYDTDDMRLMPTLNLGATLKDVLGYHDQSIAWYNKALEIMEANGRADSYDYARIMNNKAGAVFNRGGALEAIALYEEALALTEKFDDVNNNRSSVYYNMANMLNSIGYRNKALEYIDASIAAIEETKDEFRPLAHYTYALKANLLSLLDRFDETEPYLKTAEDIILKNYPDDYGVHIEFERRKAAILIDAGRYEQGLALVRKALETFEVHDLDIHANNRGEIFFLAGETATKVEDKDRAIYYYRRSIDDFIAGAPRQKMQAGYSYSKIAEVLLNHGQVDSAANAISRGLAVLLNAEEDDPIRTSSPIDAYYPLQYLNHVLNTKIQVLLRLHEQTGDKELLKVALEDSYILEEEMTSKQSAYLEDEDAIGRIAELYSYYETIINTRLLAAAQLDRPDLIELALATIEPTKDLLYKDALKKALPTTGRIPDSLALIEENLSTTLDRLEEAIVKARLDDPDKLDGLQRKKNRLIREFDVYKLQLEENFPEYYSEKYAQEGFDLSALGQYCEKTETTILQYFIGDSMATVFVITKSGVEAVSLVSPITINTVVNRAIENIRNVGNLAPLRSAYDLVITPVIGSIKTENLLIIPDGLLHFLPFEALVDDGDRYLLEDHVIAYAHSLGSVILTSQKKWEQRVLSAAPGFDEEVKNYLHDIDNEHPMSGFLRQPNAVKLAQEAASILSGRSLSGLAAREDIFKTSVDSSDVVVLATHAEVEDAFPLYSRISLLPDTTGKEDGMLHAFEVLSLPMDHELAILTACETGLGALDRGQGASSLSQAFRLAGCDNVIMSLWSIDEKQSVAIMEDFLKGYKDRSGSLPEILTQAKRNYLASAQGDLKHPYYWSGLVLIGSPEGSSSSSTWIWIISVILIVTGISMTLRKKKE
jgi:CHAT domain-containing protein/tetratricopeptide (TPR) repeat protein